MNTKEGLIIFGSIASVILLVLYFTRQAESGGSVQAVYEVSGITPEVAGIRSTERIAKIQANRDTALGYIQYLLGTDENLTAKDISQIQSNRDISISKQEMESATAIAGIAGNTQVSVSNNELQSNNFNALTQKEVANINANAAKDIVKKQASAQKWSSFWGGLFGGVGKIFGL